MFTGVYFVRLELYVTGINIAACRVWTHNKAPRKAC
jgi:hypothetical protein